MGTTLAAMQTAITTRLGSTGRAVELTNGDFAMVIASALKVLARYHPMNHYIAMPISVGVSKYHLNVPNLLGVLDVTFYNNGGRFTAFPYPDAAIDQELILGEMKIQEKVYGSLPEWEFVFDTDAAAADVEKGYLLIYFNADSFVDRAGRIPTHMSVKYAWHIEASDDKKVGLPRLRYDWQEWVEKYATAEARRVLGTIRSKFKGLPGPGEGEVLGIDGDDLIARADQEVKDLIADIESRQRQLPILID